MIHTFLLLAFLLSFSSCSKNHSQGPLELPHMTQKSSPANAQNQKPSFSVALREFQKDSTIINTSRVAVNDEEVPLLTLTTALMLSEDTATIELLLAQGADIKAADREGTGILHALVGNNRLSDQQKVELINHCFDRVDADAIQTNATGPCRRLRERLPNPLSTPWIEAFYQGDRKTAMTIVNRMSCKAAYQGALYHAMTRKLSYGRACVENKNLIQMLLDKRKESRQKSLTQLTKCIGKYIPVEDILRKIVCYTEERINMENYMPFLYCNGGHQKVPFWAYAWIKNDDIETAMQIIRSFPGDLEKNPMSSEEIAAQANAMLAVYRRYAARDWGEEDTNAWQRIKEAFVEIGICQDLLSDCN